MRKPVSKKEVQAAVYVTTARTPEQCLSGHSPTNSYATFTLVKIIAGDQGVTKIPATVCNDLAVSSLKRQGPGV